MRRMRELPAAPSPPVAATCAWTSLGPAGLPDGVDIDSGRATAVVTAPGNPNLVYLGTASGGVWKSSDGGATWTSIFDGNASIAVGSLAMDPNDSSVLYVGTGEGNFSLGEVSGVGSYKTTDAGTTWALPSLPWACPLPEHTLRRIVVGHDGTREGSYGIGSGGERPPAGAGGACAYAQVLSGSRP